MILQIKLLLLLLNLFLGLWVIGIIYHRVRLYNSLYLNLVLRYAIFTEAIFLAVFLFQYFEVNILQREIEVYRSSLVSYTFSLIYLTLFLLICTMYEISLAFQNRRLTRKRAWRLYGTVLLVVVLVHATSAIWGVNRGHALIFYIYDNLGLLFPLTELFLLARLWVRSRGSSPENKVIRYFAILYVSRYPLILLALLLPDPFRSFMAILLLHLIPLIWIRYFVDRFEKAARLNAELGSKLEKLSFAYQITARESDILKLMLQGKNNKEIQEELFISYHTVKNHVYNIFQKLGISSRYQLLTLVNEKLK
jgi:DNA-binding CsgD family transcriptional regulator